MKNNVYNHNKYGYSVKIDHVANQTNGSVWLQSGETVLLATVVRENVSSDFPGFFPLSVEYRELFSAVGKIPGGYFKREGKPTDKEVLSGRIIDRTLRPLFPDNYFDKIHLVAGVYSLDDTKLPISLALMASSLALCISDVPFLKPAGCCEVARVNGEWIFYPTNAELLNSDVRLVVAGTKDGINMVEGAFEGLSEEELLDVLFKAHDYVKEQVEWQEEILKTYSKQKNNETIFDDTIWKNKIRAYLTSDLIESIFVSDKIVRGTNLKKIQTDFIQSIKSELEEANVSEGFILYVFDGVLEEKITELIFKNKKRIDGRNFDEIRAIKNEVSLLPRNHGSALFIRGRTQLLVSTTLGSGDDESRIESLIPDNEYALMLHYNFLPLSVGEARALRAPGRREVGHGHLALNALKAILPNKKDFPYAIRIVADTLESDGSTSMATVCGGTLSLMDAGVPIKDMVAGIAMGMLQNAADKSFSVITDIAGFEDAFGLMDFKVAGTKTNVTAIQMDIKYKGGLSKEILGKALEAAKKGRLHILSIMTSTIDKPRANLSPYAPQFTVLKINKEKIGAVIGSGGKVIKDITAKSETAINIEDDGTVKIFGQKGLGLDKAVSWIKLISGDITIGMKCDGIIKKIAEFGYFVEIAPGTDGLVHISSIPKHEQPNFKTKFKEGDKVSVTIIEYDSMSNRIRLKLAE